MSDSTWQAGELWWRRAGLARSDAAGHDDDDDNATCEIIRELYDAKAKGTAEHKKPGNRIRRGMPASHDQQTVTASGREDGSTALCGEAGMKGAWVFLR